MENKKLPKKTTDEQPEKVVDDKDKIKEQLDLALNYYEDGAWETAIDLLEGVVEDLKMVPKSPVIKTVRGTAVFVKTEKEDENGKWNDSYSTQDGYYIKHNGRFHYVYKLKEEASEEEESQGVQA